MCYQLSIEFRQTPVSIRYVTLHGEFFFICNYLIFSSCVLSEKTNFKVRLIASMSNVGDTSTISRHDFISFYAQNGCIFLHWPRVNKTRLVVSSDCQQ